MTARYNNLLKVYHNALFKHKLLDVSNLKENGFGSRTINKLTPRFLSKESNGTMPQKIKLVSLKQVDNCIIVSKNYNSAILALNILGEGSGNKYNYLRKQFKQKFIN